MIETSSLAALLEPTDLSAVRLARSDEVRRRELGAFLRSRRERITPEQVGLPLSGRRRTPGLRREEVALLAGVGVTWYTWLEQGRDIHASEHMLEAIARTLLFDPQEHAHLFALAGTPEREPQLECQSLAPSVRVVLDQLDPIPACVMNARFDILAFNRTYSQVVEDVALLPFEERNTLWLLFTKPSWRTCLVDWHGTVRRMVAQLRGAMAEHVAEPAWKSFVARLKERSPEFESMWERHEVAATENRTKVLINRRVGLLRFDYVNLWFGPRLGTRLVIYTPADVLTQQRLQLLGD